MLRYQYGLIGICLAFLAAGCQSSLQADVETALYNPEQTGIRWGLVIADMDGNELLTVQADQRFSPASNTKIITSMATYHHLSALSSEATNPGTRIFIEQTSETEPPNLILKGGGDALLADAPDCEAYCLAALADEIAAMGITEIASVIGDDTLFPFERWGPGWSVEDLQYYFGTAVSALSLNDNLVWIDVQPGAVPGDAASVSWQTGDAYYELTNDVRTIAADTDRALRVERYPGAETVRLYGTVPAGSAPLEFGLAIHDPAEFAAMRLKKHLQDRGITVGPARTKHRPLRLIDEAPDLDADNVSRRPRTNRNTEPPVAVLRASPLTESLARISKDSENLHAEIAVRRMGLLEGSGSRDHGVAMLRSFLAEAGLPEHGYAIHGGSGMSVYNRISPRSMVRLIAYAAQQPWFEAWRADQPIGGVDGSLEHRFVGTPLEGKIFAKTGTLNGANALSGIMVAASGRELIFSILANDRPAATRSAIAEMDAALAVIAAAY